MKFPNLKQFHPHCIRHCPLCPFLPESCTCTWLAAAACMNGRCDHCGDWSDRCSLRWHQPWTGWPPPGWQGHAPCPGWPPALARTHPTRSSHLAAMIQCVCHRQSLEAVQVTAPDTVEEQNCHKCWDVSATTNMHWREWQNAGMPVLLLFNKVPDHQCLFSVTATTSSDKCITKQNSPSFSCGRFSTGKIPLQQAGMEDHL